MSTTLVAGASGSLGRCIVHELKRRGRPVRALTRHPTRLGPVAELCDEIVVGDALRPESLPDAVRGAQTVVSCLGASVNPGLQYGRKTFSRVDTPANCNLISAAASAGVAKFIYVSVCGAQQMRHLDYFGAHALVEDALRTNSLSHAIIRPTGFFSAMGELLRMAARGPLPQFGDGTARTNPIHEADLAGVCVDALADGPREIEAGGPEVLTRRQIAELAFSALQRRPRIIRVPVLFPHVGRHLLRPFNPRVSDLIAFLLTIMRTDVVAPPVGRQRLADYFARQAERLRG